jgi:hypothetical protein
MGKRRVSGGKKKKKKKKKKKVFPRGRIFPRPLDGRRHMLDPSVFLYMYFMIHDMLLFLSNILLVRSRSVFPTKYFSKKK